MHLLNDVQEQFRISDTVPAELRTRHLLLGRGFSDDMIADPFTSLSGG